MAKSSEYWKKRLENIAATQNKRADDYIESLELQYKKAMASIQRDLEAFYARYANAEGVDMATARKLLSNAEKEMWEVSLEEYRKMALDEELIEQIESMYSKSRVSRLKALEMQIRAQLETLYSELNTELGALLTDTFADTYYQTVYEIQKGTGIGTNFALFNEDAVKKIVSKPWKWGHFSSTVWNNKDLLLGELEIALSQAFIRGDRIDKVIKTFDKRMGVGYSRAANIIQTEHAYIVGEATFKGYEETGVERYQYLATLDTRTSTICRDMDGEKFKLSEKVVWLNYPPLHCRCRSTTVPYFEDEESYGKRIARDYEGKVYYVPEEMTYHDWYDKYVKGNPDELLAEKKHQNRHSDKKQYERYKELLGKEVPRSLDEFQNLKYTDDKKWKELKDKFKVENVFNKIVQESANLHIKGISIRNIQRINIEQFEYAEAHINSERLHGVTKSMAQQFINEAQVAYSRWNGQVTVYVSKKGCSVVNLNTKTVSTAYRSEEYDEKFKKILEVIDNDKMSNS